MTVVTPILDGSMFRSVSVAAVHGRLADLLRDPSGRAGWWVEVCRQLDDLADAVDRSPGDMVDSPGFTEQIRADAPHLMSRWVRLAAERDRLAAAVAEVRLLAGRYAGDPAHVATMSHAIRELLTRVRRLQERTTDVLLDAYERDIGGE